MHLNSIAFIGATITFFIFTWTASTSFSPEAWLTHTQAFPEAYYGPGAERPETAEGTKFGQSSPPFYPSPWMNGEGDWVDAYHKAREFVSQMTLVEKVNLTTGSTYHHLEMLRVRF